MSDSHNPSPTISQTIGTNTGIAQAAGQDAHATQQITQVAGGITKDDAIALLREIETLIQTANLPPDVTAEAVDYTQMALKEAAKDTPKPSLVVGNLEGATSLIHRLGNTTDAANALIAKLKDPLMKLAGWLGVAAAHFLG